ncbi:UNVERIFIED_CONTAM: Dol-P-Man:Man(7)GlcNAc(2)-PP-Dol alpha-1,6-mannosyltransferase [Sesamum indicum]
MRMALNSKFMQLYGNARHIISSASDREGALFVSILASPFVLAASLLHLPKIYSLYAGCIILSTLRLFRIQISDAGIPVMLFLAEFPDLLNHFCSHWIRKNFGSQVEVFFVILTALQFHMLFYCTRPLPNILAFGLVNLAYDYWFKGSFYAALNYLSRSISLRKAILSCLVTALFCIGLTILVDSVLWRKLLWPELEVFWFNSVLNRSSEWGLGVLLDRRIRFYVIPVLSFVLLYSKLPHKELRFIISSLPIFNLSAAIAASRIYNNRKKSFWKYLHVAMLGLFLIRLNEPVSADFTLCSLGCTVLTFMASYENYPSGHALKALHKMGHLTNNSKEVWVHIDTFSAMNGISRFCENNEPWRYSKEEGILLQEFQGRNFTYLLSEHALIHGYKCLFSTKGFSGARLHVGFPPMSLVSGEASTILQDGLA